MSYFYTVRFNVGTNKIASQYLHTGKEKLNRNL